VTARLAFVLSDAVVDDAARTFAEHARRIRARLPNAEVRHRGGTSVTGVLTSGDVDAHVRVERGSFELARNALGALYEPLYPDAWSDESAYFVAADAQPAVEVALTVMGTLDDLHHGEAWDRIAHDPALRERYNSLKREHEGGSADAYAAAKRAFFRAHFRPS
jgi:GrpB-like predicted nucleotidyltransferase (UPF0157 family)